MGDRQGAQSHSRRFALDGVDLRKLGTGFLVALVGAAATFLTDAATAIDFGMWSPFVAMTVSVVVNALRKWAGDNAEPEPAAVELSESTRDRRPGGWTTETVILVLTALTIGVLCVAAMSGRRENIEERPAEEHAAADDVVRVFVLQRQLFARVCLEAAKRERAGLTASEEDENAWCEPRWAAARSEAFGLLADARDRQLPDGWTPEASAAGLEAWAVAADPSLATEVGRR